MDCDEGAVKRESLQRQSGTKSCYFHATCSSIIASFSRDLGRCVNHDVLVAPPQRPLEWLPMAALERITTLRLTTPKPDPEMDNLNATLLSDCRRYLPVEIQRHILSQIDPLRLFSWFCNNEILGADARSFRRRLEQYDGISTRRLSDEDIHRISAICAMGYEDSALLWTKYKTRLFEMVEPAQRAGGWIIASYN
jgi:hypothetical protein